VHRGFTQRYHVTDLVYYEELDGPNSAIAREKQLKGWTRARKVALVEAGNPDWLDLSAGWYGDGGPPWV
jgi:putative endonuclease